jgi:hypothetical protein
LGRRRGAWPRARRCGRSRALPPLPLRLIGCVAPSCQPLTIVERPPPPPRARSPPSWNFSPRQILRTRLRHQLKEMRVEK